MVEVTEADKLATKQHQQRFLTEGRSETELLWEAFATHRIEAAKAERNMLDAAYLEAFDVHMSLIVTNWPKIKHVPTAIALAAKTMDAMVSFQTLRNLSDELVARVIAGFDKLPRVATNEEAIRMTAAALADALESKQ